MKAPHRLMLLFLAFLASALTLAPAVRAAGSHQFLFEISSFTAPGGITESLNGPCGLAVDAASEVYASDYYHDQIVVFGPSGSAVTKIHDSEPFNGPCGLAVGPGGSLYVNGFHGQVIKYQPSSFPPGPGTTYTAQLIDPGPATGVAVDPASGNVFVSRRTFIAEYEPSGAPVLVAGLPVKVGQGALVDAYGIAVSGHPATAGRIYAADAGSQSVKAFDQSNPSVQVAVIDGLGAPAGGFSSLRDAAVAVAANTGNIFVTDNLESEGVERPAVAVQEFNPAGEYRGGLPPQPSLFWSDPTGIAVDASAGPAQGRVYVTSGNDAQAAVYAFARTGPGQRLRVSLTGAGAGTVRSAPAGISCPGACAAEYTVDESVLLTAAPAPGAVFLGWSGGGCSGTGTCRVSMDEELEVVADFGLDAGAAAIDRLATQSSASDDSPGASTGYDRGSSDGPAAQTSEVVRQHGLRMRLKAKISPQALPRKGFAPIAFTVGGRIASVDGGSIPQLKTLRIDINRHGRIDYRGLPTCSVGRIDPASTSRALRACRAALVGEGRFWATIVLANQPSYPTQGRLLIFNGRLHGRPALLGQIYSPHPFATSFVIPFAIEQQAHGQFGTALVAPLPGALGDWGYLTGIEMRLWRRYRHAGVQHSFLSAGCPAPSGFSRAAFPLMRARFSFADGRDLSSTVVRTCAAR
jgi:hypothetical protein